MAAYRACETLTDRRTGERFDFSRKSGLLYSEVIAPQDAPEWARDRAQLWNRSEAAHTREKAIVAREIQLSLPHELNQVERRELTCQFASYFADRYGVAVDTCIHAPNKDGDQRNYHAHLLVCTRPIDETKKHGLGNNVRAFDAVASQRSDDGNHVEEWRATWAGMMNDALERAHVHDEDGAAVTVDHRSYKARGIEQEPTIKEGTAATALKRRGEYTERAEINGEIKARNAERTHTAPENVRRSAHLMRAEELNALLQIPEDEPSVAPDNLRRTAQFQTAAELSAQLQAPDLREDYFEPLPWETEDEAHERATRAIEEAKQRESEQQTRKDDWGFSR